MAGLTDADGLGSYDDRLLEWDTPTAQPGDPVDPYPEWRRLREDDPITFTDFEGIDKPLVHIFRYRDVDHALKNTEDLSNRIQGEVLALGDMPLIGMDPPLHRERRNLVTPPFSRKTVEKWDQVLVRKTIDQIIDEVEQKGQGDFVADIARAYPTLVVSRIIGLPEEDWELFKAWAPVLLAAPLDRDAALAVADEVRAYLTAFHAGERSVPEDSVLHSLMRTQAEGADLSDEDIDSFVMQMIQAGIDTTYRGLSNAVSLLIDRPELLEEVRRDRSLVEGAIEEGLRFEPPNVGVVRIAENDLELAGRPVEAGSIVCANIASANRDPEFCEEPDVFDVRRKQPRRHITFGLGVHQCIGLHLARLELRVGLDAVLDRLPNLRRDEEETERVGAHIRGLQFRSPTALPILWDPASN